ncbi:MAG: hypothetical protein ABI559_01620 [Chloroflexota bacterium]
MKYHASFSPISFPTAEPLPADPMAERMFTLLSGAVRRVSRDGVLHLIFAAALLIVAAVAVL